MTSTRTPRQLWMLFLVSVAKVWWEERKPTQPERILPYCPLPGQQKQKNRESVQPHTECLWHT